MSSTAFEKLASRGTPTGAAALLARAEDTISEVGHLVEPPRRRWSGLTVAAAVFATVLAFGGLWALLARQGDDAAIDEFGVEWIELIDQTGMREALTAGPGGFIYPPFGAARGALEFSPSGRDWVEVELPGLEGFAFVQSAGATNDTWVVTVEQNDAVKTWVSSDGQTWSPVVWPDSIGDTVRRVVASGGGLMAVSEDIFGEGSTLWWSVDGASWEPIEGNLPGDVDDAVLSGTGAGIVWIPRDANEGSSQEIFHSVDGVSWIEGIVELPAEMRESPTQLSLATVEYVGDQWIALGEVDRTGAEPVVYAWTSVDGIEWTARGIPEFGLVADRAVSLAWRQSAVIGDVYVVAPSTVPITERDDGIVTANGGVISTGELWATNDGVSWARVLKTSDEIVAITGSVTTDRQAIGIWMRKPRPIGEETVVETTAMPVPPQDLDQAGLNLQDEMLDDGVVTEDEFRRALEGWKACMEQRGVTGVHFEINQRGGYGTGYDSPPELSGEVEDAVCRASFLDKVETALFQ
ncbi:MAG: hypothetical protein GY926_10770 [bacterium]|nr:hypothetical protein [bacterium]MCP4965707.1 hypothetical protein [bacterium]